MSLCFVFWILESINKNAQILTIKKKIIIKIKEAEMTAVKIHSK